MKFNFGKHQSLDENIKKSVKWICEQKLSKGIKIGISEAAKHRYPKGTIRVMREVPGGLLVQGYGSTVITKIFIPTDKIDELKQAISTKWG